MKKFDAIIIGTGQSGPPLAVRLAKAGRKVAVIERKCFGGTCVNVGCIPSKTLIASARAAHVARRAKEFGVNFGGEVSVDMKRVKARKDEVVHQSNEGVTTWLEKTENLTIIRGHARFESAKSVKVGDDVYEADQFFIDVGGRAGVPKIAGLESVSYLTNSTMMEVDFLPEHLVILGGSYIGLEFAQMYRRFGSKVTVIEKSPRIIAREDEDVSSTIQKFLEDEGVVFKLGAECKSAQSPQNKRDSVIVDISTNGKPEQISGSHLLVAVGRVPNTDDLGIEKAGIKTDARGFITVDDQLRTNVENIWAMGDVNARGAFTHTSYNDYEIVAANLLDKDPRKVSDRILCYALYTDPPLGRIGMTETEVRKSGKKALIGVMQMARVGRARERSETTGFMKVLVDAESKKILGASLLGIEADEVVHLLLDVMYAGAPYTTIQRAVHIHPTVSELVPTLLGDLKPLS
jgi:pyruvate/2-oxoglutarate dehydrogenase complex dihydrolipoamide dehydrogenase (E3) component